MRQASLGVVSGSAAWRRAWRLPVAARLNTNYQLGWDKVGLRKRLYFHSALYDLFRRTCGQIACCGDPHRDLWHGQPNLLAIVFNRLMAFA
jgi:hypothetical protein